MNVKLINNVLPPKFNFEDVTEKESEIISEALIMYKSKLDAEEFKDVRNSCIEMHHLINSELITARS